MLCGVSFCKGTKNLNLLSIYAVVTRNALEIPEIKLLRHIGAELLEIIYIDYHKVMRFSREIQSINRIARHRVS